MSVDRNRVVLLVDDEPEDLDAARRALESHDEFTIYMATDFDGGLSEFKKHAHEVDLAVVDVALPGKNGVELAKQILMARPEARILFVSGHVGASVIRFYGIEAHDEHFLRKPFDGASLLQRVDELLKSNQRLQLHEATQDAVRSRAAQE